MDTHFQKPAEPWEKTEGSVLILPTTLSTLHTCIASEIARTKVCCAGMFLAAHIDILKVMVLC